jgi:hypothetical protein
MKPAHINTIELNAMLNACMLMIFFNLLTRPC